MAVLRREDNDRSPEKVSIPAIIVLAILYLTMSSVIGFDLISWGVIPVSSIAYAVSFSSLGILLYFATSLIWPDGKSRFESRLLHELAKRGLVEFKYYEDE